MLVQSPYLNFSAHLVDWQVIEPYWLRNTFHPLDRTTLTRSFHQRWFQQDQTGRTVFVTGAIDFDEQTDCIMFVNGRHRTNLLLLYNSRVPVALSKTVLEHPELRRAVVQDLNENSLVKLPDLPLVDSSHFKTGQAAPASRPSPATRLFSADS